MKLALIDLTPSSRLKKVLLANHIQFQTGKSFKSPVDLLLVHIKKEKDLAGLKKMREEDPNAWLQVVIDQKLLDNPVFYSTLLACKEKNSVAFKQTWESTLWLTIDQMNQVSSLKSQVETLKTAVEDMNAQSQKLVGQFEKNVHLAETIQRAMLPKFSPQIPGINISAKYIPAMGLGGDYYDIFEFGDKHRFGVILSDSKTHGMAAALLSILIKLRLEELKERFSDTSRFLYYLNQEFHTSFYKDISSLNFLYGIMDRVSLTFQYTVAGALEPLLFRNGKPVPIPRASAPPLGEMDHFTFQEHRVTLKPGDTLLLHTDGLNALFDQSPTQYFSGHLFSKEQQPNPLQLQNAILARLDSYREKKEIKDDITFLSFLIDERAIYLAKNR